MSDLIEKADKAICAAFDKGSRAAATAALSVFAEQLVSDAKKEGVSVKEWCARHSIPLPRTTEDK